MLTGAYAVYDRARMHRVAQALPLPVLAPCTGLHAVVGCVLDADGHLLRVEGGGGGACDSNLRQPGGALGLGGAGEAKVGPLVRLAVLSPLKGPEPAFTALRLGAGRTHRGRAGDSH